MCLTSQVKTLKLPKKKLRNDTKEPVETIIIKQDEKEKNQYIDHGVSDHTLLTFFVALVKLARKLFIVNIFWCMCKWFVNN